MSSMPDLDQVDFDEIYRGSELYEGARGIPWDIGGPQPVVVELAETGEITGEVLDVGCGLGDNTIFLASRGYRVTGVDGAPSAIASAREKARGLDAEFAVADATELAGFEDRFDTIVDSALFHCLNEEQQRSYSAALHRVARSGARLHVFAGPDDIVGIPVPHPVDPGRLRAVFGSGWEIVRIEKAMYSTRFGPEDVEHLNSAVPGAGDALAGLGPDTMGRFRMPVWHLAAVRRP